ncbi:MAG: hypothetical protein ACMG57_00415 [Candidatus Dojkabacteria bacterium]
MRKYVPFTVTFAILAIFTSLIGYTSIYAQDASTADLPAEIKDFDGLKAEFRQNTQDPDSKNIKFEMVLHSNIDSDRVKVTWTVSGASKMVNTSEKRVDLDIRKGQTYTIPITILPVGKGISEVYGTAQSVSVESSFLVTVRKNYSSNSDSEVLPITQEYQTAKSLLVVKNVLILVLVIGGVIATALLVFRRINKYLKTEPEVTFENEVDTNAPLTGK